MKKDNYSNKNQKTCSITAAAIGPPKKPKTGIGIAITTLIIITGIYFYRKFSKK